MSPDEQLNLEPVSLFPREFQITKGMETEEDAMRLQAALLATPGVENATVDFSRRLVAITAFKNRAWLLKHIFDRGFEGKALS